MKRVYTDNSVLRCGMVRGLLDANGIRCLLRTEAMSGMFGGGGYNPHLAWPEVWVDDGDAGRAEELIGTMDADCSDDGREARD